MRSPHQVHFPSVIAFPLASFLKVQPSPEKRHQPGDRPSLTGDEFGKRSAGRSGVIAGGRRAPLPKIRWILPSCRR
jgi:hypothetical protein